MELLILVNAEKHKAKRQVAQEELLQDLDLNLIDKISLGTKILL